MLVSPQYLVNVPSDLRVSFVDGFAAPSVVVLNSILPGVSFAPGVPSTKKSSAAKELFLSVPSAPTIHIDPNLSLFATIVAEPSDVPLDLPSCI